MLKVGDPICYMDTKAEDNPIFHGIVLEIKEQIRISYHDTAGQQILWVDASEIEAQDTSRCAHNAECGWCDDTGHCIYEQAPEST